MCVFVCVWEGPWYLHLVHQGASKLISENAKPGASGKGCEVVITTAKAGKPGIRMISIVLIRASKKKTSQWFGRKLTRSEIRTKNRVTVI